ncbi:MAG: MerR family transcriptional regulator [Firmicutes bacterium]|nr:MerR family transcriptional regulator [Bacillota bacterium]
MLISKASRQTKLTKKAIEYYAEQGLIFPVVSDNGYRDFSERDVECLNKISVLRKLGLHMSEIKTVLADETGKALQRISIQNELNMQRWQAKKTILDKLRCGANYSAINAELDGIESNATITEKLLEAFPGFYTYLQSKST